MAKEIEQGIKNSEQLKGIDLPYPLRWITIKLLEGQRYKGTGI